MKNENYLDLYRNYLLMNDYGENTIDKYVRDVRSFFRWMGERSITQETVLGWKYYLIGSYTPSSVNSMLGALNCFLRWMKLERFCVKSIRIQKEVFANPEKELTKEEYFRLIRTAKEKENERLSLLLQTICSTGIRVSELAFITVKSLGAMNAAVWNKGKSRKVFLPAKLCRLLRLYCSRRGIVSGPVFCTKSGKPLNRSNIWKEMKKLCVLSGVPEEKVYPHNLRHLFARVFYSVDHDLSRLADLLGHTSVSTTRIYIKESGIRHLEKLELMGLVQDQQESVRYIT